MYGTIVVVGGGCYGSYYVRQLARAREADALTWERLLVVDHDPACRVATEAPAVPGLEVICSAWAPWFDQWLAAPRAADDRDAIVPSPLMPHLMAEWIARQVGTAHGGRAPSPVPLPRVPSTPWQRAGADGTHYVSFAEWMCPVNCVEPAVCPAISGPRTWSMPRHVAAYVAAERDRGLGIAGPVVLHCAHRAYGVGMFDVAVVQAGATLAREAVRAGQAATDGHPDHLLVATVSHCHGAWTLLPLSAPDSR